MFLFTTPTNSDVFLSANINPVELPVPGDGCKSSRAMGRSVKNLQRYGGSWQLVLDVWRRHAGGGHSGWLQGHLPTSSTASATVSTSRGGGVGVFGLDLVLLLVVEKITSRSIGTIPWKNSFLKYYFHSRDCTCYPIFLASFSLIFAMLSHISHFLGNHLAFK